MQNIVVSHMYVNSLKNEYLNTRIQTNFTKSNCWFNIKRGRDKTECLFNLRGRRREDL